MIADDDEDDQFIIKEALSDFGGEIQVTSVKHGVQLLEFLNKKNSQNAEPDMIVLDINMPLMNGLEALTQIKSDEKLKSIPVFMLSTMRTIDRVDKSLELGALNYYSKPNRLIDYKPIFKEMLDQTMFSDRRISA